MARRALAHAGAGAGLFDSVHVDVKPHAHPGWTGDQARVGERFLDLLRVLADHTRPATTLKADTAWWFHRIAAGNSSHNREVLQRLDAVTVPAYRKHATGIDGTIALATPQVRAAAELRRPIRIGQETTHLGNSPDDRKQTFHDHTQRHVERELRIVERAFAGSPTCAGLATTTTPATRRWLPELVPRADSGAAACARRRQRA